jgi:hypothetical protein
MRKQPVNEDTDDVLEIDEDSDIVVHEKFVREKKIKRIK